MRYLLDQSVAENLSNSPQGLLRILAPIERKAIGSPGPVREGNTRQPAIPPVSSAKANRSASESLSIAPAIPLTVS